MKENDNFPKAIAQYICQTKPKEMEGDGFGRLENSPIAFKVRCTVANRSATMSVNASVFSYSPRNYVPGV